MFFIKHEIHKIVNTLSQWSINMTHENKTWVNMKVSVQIQCEEHDHENIQLDSCEIPLNMKTWNTNFSFKQSILQGICMSSIN